MPMQTSKPELVLASRSRARMVLLTGAGLVFRTQPADLDEARLRAEIGPAPADVIAASLAEAKAQHISRTLPDALIIGADQVLGFDEEILSKPADRAAAALQLQRLAGNSHQLHSACAVAMKGEIVWHCCDSATLTMRMLSDEFIAGYLNEAGDSVLGSVGAYQLEGLGAHLFDEIKGDYFTILGLPLLPLLAYLRKHGVIAS